MNKSKPSPSSTPANDRATIALLFAAALLILSSLYLTVPLVPILAEHFRLSTGRASWAGSGFSLFFAFGCLVFGPLSDRLGRKRVMLAGLVVLAATTLAAGFAQSFGALLAIRCLQGAAAATFSPVALTYAGEAFPPGRRIAAISMISTGFLMAGIFGQLWAGFISELFGWVAVFILLAVLYAAIAILMAFYLPAARVVPGTGAMAAGNRKSRLLPWIRPLSNPYLWLCYIIAFLLLFCFVGMYSVLGEFLGRSPYALTGMQIIGVRAFGLIGMAGCLISGKLCAAWGKLPVLRGGLLLAAAGLVSLSLAHSVAAYIVTSIIFVAGIAVAVPALIALIGEIGSAYRAAATSLYTFILFIGASGGPIASTRLIELGSAPLPFLVFAGMMAAGVVSALLIQSPGQSIGERALAMPKNPAR
ncbi:MFS transporter [Cohnella sp. GbtcB17]|uniref:MFS transporter n=1 Tax=Cohnella sp. GbtcB17 TaxID=2824762 RepID=UPI001C30037E|nr:MFS transporter [Cohnella sp. GbtcB17]